jgi:hypothetical protein
MTAVLNRLSLMMCAASLIATRPLHTQVPSPTVSIGFGVDTSITDVRNVVSLVRAYLAKPDSTARSRGLWSSATEFDRRIGDITAGQANVGFPATVIGVISDGPGDSVYVVKILYARADSANGIAPLAMTRLYAVREVGAPYSFRLAGALPRVTRNWERRSKRHITFWYAPGHKPNPAKIDRAARFVDSVAKLFSVPPPEHLDVYVGDSMDEVQRAIGLDFYTQSSGPGQRSGGLDIGSILLMGNPQIGEEYLHEFVHAVLGASLPTGSRLLSEGVATWLGGSRGRSTREMFALLRSYQQADSTLSFTTLVRNGFSVSDADRGSNLLYATGALIVDALYRRNGIASVRRIYQLQSDPNTLLRALAIELAVPPDDASLDRWWRMAAARR